VLAQLARTRLFLSTGRYGAFLALRWVSKCYLPVETGVPEWAFTNVTVSDKFDTDVAKGNTGADSTIATNHSAVSIISGVQTPIGFHSGERTQIYSRQSESRPRVRDIHGVNITYCDLPGPYAPSIESTQENVGKIDLSGTSA